MRASPPIPSLLDHAKRPVVSLNMIAGSIDVDPAEERDHTLELAGFELCLEDFGQVFEAGLFNVLEKESATSASHCLVGVLIEELQHPRCYAAKRAEFR